MSTRDKQTDKKRQDIPLEERGSSRDAQRRAAEGGIYTQAMIAQFILEGQRIEDALDAQTAPRAFDADIMERVADSERLAREDKGAQDRMNMLIMGTALGEDVDQQDGQTAENTVARGLSQAYDNINDTMGFSGGRGRSSSDSGLSSQRASGSLGGLLDYIGRFESHGHYDMMVGGRRNPNLTNMTVDEVLSMQAGMIGRGHESTAVGKYQIIRDTLRGLKRTMGLSGDELFDERMQDRMATVLMEQRGLNRFLRGDITAAQFQNNLAKEWASMPTTEGRSHYAGVGSNRSLTGAREFQAQILSLG